MSDGEILRDPAPGYQYAPEVSLVCPKCGHTSSFPLAAKLDKAIEYAGVCGATYARRSYCDAVLNVRVTSHLFPARS